MLLDRYLPRIEFNSYEDFKENYKVNIPENFNFGFADIRVLQCGFDFCRALCRALVCFKPGCANGFVCKAISLHYRRLLCARFAALCV